LTPNLAGPGAKSPLFRKGGVITLPPRFTASEPKASANQRNIRTKILTSAQFSVIGKRFKEFRTAKIGRSKKIRYRNRFALQAGCSSPEISSCFLVVNPAIPLSSRKIGPPWMNNVWFYLVSTRSATVRKTFISQWRRGRIRNGGILSP